MPGMKSWDELTERGRLRRTRNVALAALEQYPVEVTGLSLIGGFVNALYRVETPDGPLAIRVDVMGEHSDTDADVELGWLEALAADRVVNVPTPLRTVAGALYTHATAPGVPGTRRCALFTWVPGATLADRMHAHHFGGYGRMSALLHRHGAGHHPSSRPMAWDRVFYFPEEVDPVVWDRENNSGAFPDGGIDTVRRAIEIVEARLASITDADRQIVHGDLHIWNVHVRRSELWALDFEDVMWATPAQDLAISLYYLEGRPDRDQLVAAFRAGYEQIAPWPATDDELDVFMAARRLMFVNLVFNLGTIDVGEFLAGSIPKLEAFVARHG